MFAPRLSNDIAQIYVLAYFAEYNYDDGAYGMAPINDRQHSQQHYTCYTEFDKDSTQLPPVTDFFPSISWQCI